jgi:hypothetical protein
LALRSGEDQGFQWESVVALTSRLSLTVMRRILGTQPKDDTWVILSSSHSRFRCAVLRFTNSVELSALAEPLVLTYGPNWYDSERVPRVVRPRYLQRISGGFERSRMHWPTQSDGHSTAAEERDGRNTKAKLVGSWIGSATRMCRAGLFFAMAVFGLHDNRNSSPFTRYQ